MKYDLENTYTILRGDPGIPEIKNHGLRTPNEGINQRYLKNYFYRIDYTCKSKFLMHALNSEYAHDCTQQCCENLLWFA